MNFADSNLVAGVPRRKGLSAAIIEAVGHTLDSKQGEGKRFDTRQLRQRLLPFFVSEGGC